MHVSIINSQHHEPQLHLPYSAAIVIALVHYPPFLPMPIIMAVQTHSTRGRKREDVNDEIQKTC
jgi:hypothetical protein